MLTVALANISRGVDAKLLQYDRNAIAIYETTIGLTEIIGDFLIKKKVDENCIMINIEKDQIRYDNTVKEFEKISIKNFVHLKATYWKDRARLVDDLNIIIDFVKQFNSNQEMKGERITINEFSEVSDPNIHIQDGPLACYCSHLRSMIHGYLNFKDYTIIVEDDISIKNTAHIEQYLKCIPENWDIIFLGSVAKNQIYEEPFYRFTNEFHSAHFYIINHKCLPFLFSKMYPITDQVDVLMSDLYNQLNIYNIPNTVYQKDISTNTQNNLHAIFNSPHYWVVRAQIEKTQHILDEFLRAELPDNEKNNKTLSSLLLCDIVYHHICTATTTKQYGEDESQFDNKEEISKNTQLSELYDSLFFILRCTEKGNDIANLTLGLVNNIINTIRQFSLHNRIEANIGQTIKAYRYGATAKVYISEKNDIVIKAYDRKLRWKTADHNDMEEIFQKELSLLKKITGPNLTTSENRCHDSNTVKLLDYDVNEKKMILSYGGESLYDNFKLPEDWWNQIKAIFENLTLNNICYREFNLKNILVHDGKITFVDFGLATYHESVDNTNNCKIFIELLEILNRRFSKEENILKKYLLYTVFINNIKLHKMKKYLNNIF